MSRVQRATSGSSEAQPLGYRCAYPAATEQLRYDINTNRCQLNAMLALPE